MLKFLLIISFFQILSHTLHSQNWTEKNIAVFDEFKDFEFLLEGKNDTTYIVNFWATWCGPCVKELPYFEELHSTYKEPIIILLVSLDFKKHLDKKVVPFLNKHNIQSDVVLLEDGRANDWIDKVDPSWSGAIPITMIYKDGEKKFFEQEFHSTEELIEAIGSVK